MRVARLVVLAAVAVTAMTVFTGCKKGGGGYLTAPTPALAK